MPTLRFHKREAEARVTAGARRGVEKASQMLVRDVRQALNREWPPASLPGEYPRKRTGNLRKEIEYWMDTESRAAAWVGATVDAQYWSDLEYGTKRMAARPFLRPRAYENRDRIRQIIQSEIDKELG